MAQRIVLHVSHEQLAYDAVILAGGRGSRLTHEEERTDKAAVRLRDAPLIAGALEAARESHRCVVVGATAAALPDGVELVADDVPDAGPAYALRTGLMALRDEEPWVLVLSCDIPGAPKAVETLSLLCATAGQDVDGILALDEEGRQQWLLGFYRATALSRALANVHPHESLRRSMQMLRLKTVPLPLLATKDVDTPEDLAWWRANRR